MGGRMSVRYVSIAMILSLLAYLSFAAVPVTVGQTSAFLYESAIINTAPGGGSAIQLDPIRIVAVRFVVDSPITVTEVGGGLYSTNTGDAGRLFAAIVKLNSMTDLPVGNPFGSGVVVVASTTFNPGPANAYVDFLAPLSVRLEPGVYGLLFGAGYFGSPASAKGSMLLNSITYQSTSYFNYYEYYRQDIPAVWQENGFSGSRFVVKGVYEGQTPANSAPLVLGTNPSTGATNVPIAHLPELHHRRPGQRPDGLLRLHDS